MHNVSQLKYSSNFTLGKIYSLGKHIPNSRLTFLDMHSMKPLSDLKPSMFGANSGY